jgi:hypothetical protein
VSVLRDRQDDAIGWLRWLSIMLTAVAMLLAVGVFVSLDVSGVMLSGRRKLLEEMMHSVRRGGGEKKPKRGGDAQA